MLDSRDERNGFSFDLKGCLNSRTARQAFERIAQGLIQRFSIICVSKIPDCFARFLDCLPELLTHALDDCQPAVFLAGLEIVARPLMADFQRFEKRERANASLQQRIVDFSRDPATLIGYCLEPKFHLMN